jgi:hypothetical protein
MAADLGGSQISALLESVPGIRNVLRSPVADALVNMVRAAAGLRPFAFAEADELMQYAVRRGLINASEGEQVMADVRGAEAAARKRAREEAKAARKPAAKAGKKPAGKRPTSAKGPAKKKPARRR